MFRRPPRPVNDGPRSPNLRGPSRVYQSAAWRVDSSTVLGVEMMSTSEVAKEVGVSYRMLDHWLRHGHIDIEHGASGSGSRRLWTPEEVERLRVCVDRLNEANAVLQQFQSGELWALSAPATACS